MNKFWLKMAGFAVVVVGLIIMVKILSRAPESELTEQIQEVEEVLETPAEPERAYPPPQPRLEERAEYLEDEELNPHADNLYQMAVFHMKAGRLPYMRYKMSIDYCRQLFELYPDSKQAGMARELLRQLPEQERLRYNVTDEEMGF